MTLELIYRSQQALPFEPFDLFLADGRALHVATSELIMLDDDGRSVSLFVPPDARHVIDPELIVSLQFGEATVPTDS